MENTTVESASQIQQQKTTTTTEQSPEISSPTSGNVFIGGALQRIKAGHNNPLQLREDVMALQQTIGNRAVTQLLAQIQKQESAGNTASIHSVAAAGVEGGGGKLPHYEKIQASFGQHDVSGVKAYTGAKAASASQAIGAEAYATGNKVAFANSSPDLFTAAHEAAHIVQQRSGVHLKGGVGEAGDKYERHADSVAAKVVKGESAEPLLTGTGNIQAMANIGSTVINQRLAVQRIASMDVSAKAKGTYWETDTTTTHKSDIDGNATVPDKIIAVMKEPADGGEPSVNPPGWTWLKAKFGKLKGEWVRFHLINGKLGGRGNSARNLVPTTHALNHGVWKTDIEKPAKKNAIDDKKWTYQQVDIEYNKEFPKGIPEKITGQWGNWKTASNSWEQKATKTIAQTNPNDDVPDYITAASITKDIMKKEWGLKSAEVDAAHALINATYASEQEFDEAWAEGGDSAKWFAAQGKLYIEEDEITGGPYSVFVKNS